MTHTLCKFEHAHLTNYYFFHSLKKAKFFQMHVLFDYTRVHIKQLSLIYLEIIIYFFDIEKIYCKNLQRGRIFLNMHFIFLRRLERNFTYTKQVNAQVRKSNRLIFLKIYQTSGKILLPITNASQLSIVKSSRQFLFRIYFGLTYYLFLYIFEISKKSKAVLYPLLFLHRPYVSLLFFEFFTFWKGQQFKNFSPKIRNYSLIKNMSHRISH